MKKLATIIICALIAAAGAGAVTETAAAQNAPRVELSKRTVMVEGKLCFLHTVARKETLYSIATAYGVSPESIRKHNPFIGNNIRAGEVLLVPSADKQTPTKPKEPVFIDHKQPAPVVAAPVIEGEENSLEVAPVDSAFVTDHIAMGETRKVNAQRGLNIAMLLPLGSATRTNDVNFIDFLSGSLLAIDKLQGEGVNISLDVHSTRASAADAAEIVRNGRLESADIIIGPVYDEPFDVVGRWATARRVPIVSPLAGSGNLNNPYVICMAPTEATRYDKLREALADPMANVIYFECASGMDADMVASIEPLLPPSVRRIQYEGKLTKVEAISGALMRDVKNVVVVPVADETMVEGILTRLSSINAAKRLDISVVGTSRWARFVNMNLDLFFKLKVSYVTSYHFDRGDARVAEFVRSYTTALGAVPSLYSMRGYDAVMIMGRLAKQSGPRMLYDLPYFSNELLQVGYRFEQLMGQDSKFENSNWSLVCYNSDYTITVR